jgi:rubrerythrin
MKIDFNADEIFTMAIKIEQNGAAFYRKAAENIADQADKALLLELADMEDGHEKVFAAMQQELTTEQKKTDFFDPENEAANYLKAMADVQVYFKREPDFSSMEGIIKEAISAEKDSIVFYLGMKDLVPESLGKDNIEAIIKEEMKHIKLLSNKLHEIKKR